MTNEDIVCIEQPIGQKYELIYAYVVCTYSEAYPFTFR